MTAARHLHGNVHPLDEDDVTETRPGAGRTPLAICEELGMSRAAADIRSTMSGGRATPGLPGEWVRPVDPLPLALDLPPLLPPSRMALDASVMEPVAEGGDRGLFSDASSFFFPRRPVRSLDEGTPEPTHGRRRPFDAPSAEAAALDRRGSVAPDADPVDQLLAGPAPPATVPASGKATSRTWTVEDLDGDEVASTRRTSGMTIRGEEILEHGIGSEPDVAADDADRGLEI